MDFIGAFLQAPIRNAKFYVKLDSRYKDACHELEPYFDIPLLLNKCMYGLTFAGQFWNEELFDWLFSVGFTQSREEPAFWVRYNKHAAVGPVSPPAVKIMYPVVDFPSSGQSWNDASENTTICDGLMLIFFENSI